MNEARSSPRSARRTRLLWPLGLAALLGACAVVPTGPSMLVLPGSTKNRPQSARRAIQIVFQNPDSALNRAQSVRKILSRALEKLAGITGAKADEKLDTLIDQSLKGKSFTNTELIGLQAGMYKYTQEIDLCSKVVEKATGGLKDALKTQV